MEPRILSDILFTDTDHGWVTAGGPEGPGAIFRTRDGGRTWEEVARRGFDAHGHRFFCVWFLDPLTGWVCGEHGEGEDGVLWATSDGGESWEVWEGGAPGSGLPRSHPFFQVCFPGPDLGFLVSGGLPLLASSDGGRTWSVMEVPGAHPYGMSFLPDGRTGFLVSQDVDTLTWQSLRTVHFRTDDGGRSWTEVGDTFVGVEFGVDVAACRFWDRDRGLLCGPEGVLFGTEDGGQTWWPRSHGYTGEDLNRLHLLQGGRAFLAGSGGLVATSSDYGRTWRRLAVPTTAEIHGVWFHGDGRGFLVGEDDLFLATGNGGRTWERIRLPWEDP